MSETVVTVVGGGERIPGSSGCRLQGTQIVNTHKVKYLVDAGAFDAPPTVDPRRLDSYTTRQTILYGHGGVLPYIGLTRTPDGCVCSSGDAERQERNPRYWEVTYEFSSTEANQKPNDENNPNPDPTTWIPIWQIDNEIYEEFEPVDARGFPVVNSMGIPFDGGIDREKTIVVYKFSQYEPDTLTEEDLGSRNGIMNLTNFAGFQKYTLKLTVPSSVRGVFNGFPCRKVNYEVKYKKGIRGGFKITPDGKTWNNAPSTEYSGWRKLYLDTSPWTTISGKSQQYRSDDGMPGVANLNGSGVWAGATSGIQNPPAVLNYWRHPAVEFANFIRS